MSDLQVWQCNILKLTVDQHGSAATVDMACILVTSWVSLAAEGGPTAKPK
jgi:hypothetical protein